MPTSSIPSHPQASNNPPAGIDVSAAKLDCCVLAGKRAISRVFTNDPKGHRQLVAFLRKHRVVRVLLEQTGVYHRPIARALEAVSIHADVRNPCHVRRLAEGYGIREKTDALDAIVLAKLQPNVRPGPRYEPNPNEEELCELVAHRAQLVEQRTQILCQIHALDAGRGIQRDDPVRASKQRLRKMIEAEIKSAEQAIEVVISRCEALSKQDEIMQSVPGVGPAISSLLLAELPELGKATRKQIAKLAGVAPIAKESGRKRGERKIRGGRSPVRRALYIAALVGCRYCPELKAFRERLLANGKAKREAVVACAHKLLRMLNALVRDGDRYGGPGVAGTGG